MFAASYFAPRYFPTSYFVSVGADSTATSSGRVSAGTAWNPDWAKDYGPDVDRARKAPRKEVKAAIRVLKAAPRFEPIEEAQAIAKRTLAADLMRDDDSLVAVMTAYYAYQRWRKRNNDVAAILLLM